MNRVKSMRLGWNGKDEAQEMVGRCRRNGRRGTRQASAYSICVPTVSTAQNERAFPWRFHWRKRCPQQSLRQEWLQRLRRAQRRLLTFRYAREVQSVGDGRVNHEQQEWENGGNVR